MTDWQDMYEKEHKLRQEAEGETTIVKGIGMNSPEVKGLKARVKELEVINAEHRQLSTMFRQLNESLKKENQELRNDNRQLSKQIEDQVDRARKAGL